MENVPTGKIGETEKPISQEKVNEFAKLSWRERIYCSISLLYLEFLQPLGQQSF